jgi:hypothetical protein
VQVTIGDYIQRTSVSNFRNSWEALDPGLEKVDEYGLGPRDSLQEAVKAVINTLGMQPVEVSPRSTPTASQIPWPGGRKLSKQLVQSSLLKLHRQLKFGHVWNFVATFNKLL